MSETGIALLASLPLGDGTKRANVRLRKKLSGIARRVATAAFVAGREDIFLEVYSAGLAHATAMLINGGDLPDGD